MITPDRTISIVIPTYKRQFFLAKCLESLSNQTWPRSHYEIIIVDDGSDDGTADYVRSFQKRPNTPKIVYVKQNNRGPAVARNIGVSYAKGDIIAFIDDDCIASDNWLESIAGVFREKPDISACGAPPYQLEESNNTILKTRPERYLKFEFAPLVIIATNNCAIYKETFMKIGGFDESFRWAGGEDTDFIYKLLKRGHNVYSTAKMVVFHYTKTSFKGILRQYYIFGLTDSIVFKRYFRNWFVLDLFFMRLLNLKEFHYFKKSPLTGYLRIDMLKMLILGAGLAWFNLFFALSCLILILLVILARKGRRNTLRVIRYHLVADAAYLAGHIHGSVKNKVFYI